MTAQPHSSGADGGRLVLVLDDDAQARDLLRRELTASGFRVTTVASSSDGLPIARALKPDVVTLDIMMSGAWSLLADMKCDPTLAKIPVILLNVIPEACLTYHVEISDYLVKPIDGDRWEALVEAIRPAPAADSVLIVTNDLPARDALHRLAVQLGRTPTLAANGLDALYAIYTHDPPAFIILDLTLPGADLLPVAEALRTNERWQAIPIVGLLPMDLRLEERRSLDNVVQSLLAKGGLRLNAFARHLQDRLFSMSGKR